MDAVSEVKSFISKQNSLGTLRFITCGSVDDGKSTLLGRLLYEAQLIFDDQIDKLMVDSRKVGTQGGEIDFALLVDGLAAEREQGITIDVAYRFFSTEKRKFIVADSPGHEEYTRNMVTAASNAELAIILIDGRKGVLEQTKRHSYIAHMVGIKNIIVAINKMDLINYSEAEFIKIVDDFQKNVASELDFESVKFIPISALKGDNIVSKSKNMLWSNSEPIMSILETEEILQKKSQSFAMAVQLVQRPNLDFRGFSGNISSGEITIGEDIFVASSKKSAKVKEIFSAQGHKNKATTGDAITLTLDKEIDISRGDILVSDLNTINSSNIFNVNLIWFNQTPCKLNRNLIMKIGTKTTNCKVINFKSKINVNNLSKDVCNQLEMNDIGICELKTDEQISFKNYKDINDLGSFILIDKQTNLTVGAGIINFKPRRSDNVVWEKSDIDFQKRCGLLGHKSKLLWLTGLSGAGKSTIANKLEIALHNKGMLTYILDGDNLRHGLNNDLGFSEPDRIENLRRVGQVAKLFVDAGVVTIASFISPFAKDRDNIRSLFPNDQFFEIYIKTSIEVAKKRDPKGLYKKALTGEIPNFTGINSPYEEPINPELIIDTDKINPDKAVNIIIDLLEKND